MTTTLDRRYSPVLVEFAAEVGDTGPVAAVGGRTRWELGGTPPVDTRLVQAPAGIVDYQPEEMIVRVLAGTTVAELDSVLADAGQRSALPCRSSEATVGGALAVGENHVDLNGRGRVRDCLLQVTYVSAEGRLVTGGGPTVKNVSGFNLPRVLVGSLGTLGLFAEMILRVNPRPAVDRWIRLDNPIGGARAVRDRLLRPAALLTDGSTIWAHLEGHEVDVDAEQATLTELADANVVDGPPPLPPHRWSLAPADVLAPVGADWSAEPFIASIGAGLVWSERPQPPRPADPAVDTVARRLKDRFDPTGRLAPGRFPGTNEQAAH